MSDAVANMLPPDAKIQDYLPTVDKIFASKDLIIKRLSAAKFQARLATIAYNHDEPEWPKMSVDASRRLKSGVSQRLLSLSSSYISYCNPYNMA